MKRVSSVWQTVRVKHGAELRLLSAITMLIIGIPRLPIINDLLPSGPHRFGTPEAWGWIFVVVGTALLLTCWRWRLTITGRVIAGISAFCFMALAADTVSATSFGVDIAFALALAWEAGTSYGD